MDAGLGSNHGSKPEVLADMLLFSFVMDLADDFNAFPTSEVNPSCSRRPGSIAGARYILRHYANGQL